jgi:hypothetical protein
MIDHCNCLYCEVSRYNKNINCPSCGIATEIAGPACSLCIAESERQEAEERERIEIEDHERDMAERLHAQQKGV